MQYCDYQASLTLQLLFLSACVLLRVILLENVFLENVVH